MENLNDTRIAAIRVIKKIVILDTNVSNGCFSDVKELALQMHRLEKIKTWAIANNQLAEIQAFFNSYNFGQLYQFSGRKIKSIFFN